LESADAEIGKRTERSFEELELEEKLLRFELAILKERTDRERQKQEQKKARNDIQKAIQSARQKSKIDPEALIRHRKYQELLATAKNLEAEVESQTTELAAQQQELVDRTIAIETRLQAIVGQAASVSKAADLCVVTEKP
jgi:esterase/lipase superfamily enzyme